MRWSVLLLLLAAPAAAQRAPEAAAPPEARPEVGAAELPRAPLDTLPDDPQARIEALEARSRADAERIAELEEALGQARQALETLRARGLNQTLEEDQSDLALRACESRLQAADQAQARAERNAANAEREARSLQSRLRSAEAAERRAASEARSMRSRLMRCR